MRREGIIGSSGKEIQQVVQFLNARAVKYLSGAFSRVRSFPEPCGWES
jgi:hypothetical protein